MKRQIKSGILRGPGDQPLEGDLHRMSQDHIDQVLSDPLTAGAFRGEYEITAEQDGKTTRREITLDREGTRITLTL